MSGTVAESSLAAHGQVGQGRELTILEVVDLQRAGVLGLGGFRAVASGDHDRRTIAGHGQHLVREDAHVDPAYLRHRRTDRVVEVDAMHGDVARIVVAGEGIRAGGVHAVVDGALEAVPGARRASVARRSCPRAPRTADGPCPDWARCPRQHRSWTRTGTAATDAARRTARWTAS